MIAVHWFRRDLRLEDNSALTMALMSDLPVLPLFIFDTNITEELPPDDARITFIYNTLKNINTQLTTRGSGVLVIKGDPVKVWEELISEYHITKVFFNSDYEPYARERDHKITKMLARRQIDVLQVKDQVIFEKNEILKPDGDPYTVFTPYKRRWLEKFNSEGFTTRNAITSERFMQGIPRFPALREMGFRESGIKVRKWDLSQLNNYATLRNIPAADSTSYLSPHLRFGTVSIRQILNMVYKDHEAFTSELIWREFFMQILYHFPDVVSGNFRSKYDHIPWRNNEEEFELWCKGETGYPMVDAGMRQLNETGYMHNRVRMVTASFLCKHLLIDWRWGEAYFAKKLLDYELSSNNGNWQWAAGTGCDAAPYFRVFNPMEQQRKFDKDESYIKRWIPEYGTDDYPGEMVEHKYARERALREYKRGIMFKLPSNRQGQNG